MVALNNLTIIIAVSLTYFVVHTTGNCLLNDGTIKIVNSKWINDKGCQCQCIAYSEMNFEQCDCNKKFEEIVTSPLRLCKYNGFIYFYNETWMSSNLKCSQCRCGIGGNNVCSSDKHCSNSCQEGQIPQYNPCCVVEKCSGKAINKYVGIHCWDSKRKLQIPHGEAIVNIEICIDKMCICSNGKWKCHNYCDILNKSFVYWNKLCCPRSRVKESCNYFNQKIGSEKPVQIIETDQACFCINNQLYCDKDYTSENIKWSWSTDSSVKDNRFPIFITLLAMICFILCCLLVIVAFSNWQNYLRKMSLKKHKTDTILLNDLQNEYDVDNNVPLVNQL